MAPVRREEGVTVEEAGGGVVRETWRSVSTFSAPFSSSSSLVFPLGPLGTAISEHLKQRSTRLDESCGASSPHAFEFSFHASRGEWHGPGGGGGEVGAGTHVVSSAAAGWEELAEKVKRILGTWFVQSGTRDALHYRSDAVASSSVSERAWVSHEDGLTKESLDNFLHHIFAAEAGADVGVASLLDQRLGELGRAAGTHTSGGAAIQVSRKTGPGAGAGVNFMSVDLAISVAGEVVRLDSRFRVVSQGVPFGLGGDSSAKARKHGGDHGDDGGGSRRENSAAADAVSSLETAAEQLERWAAERLLHRCESCVRSELALAVGGAEAERLDLVGPEGHWRRGEGQERAFPAADALMRVERYLTGHPSSLFVADHYRVGVVTGGGEGADGGEAAGNSRPASLCLTTYVPTYLKPIFSASSVAVVGSNGAEKAAWILLDTALDANITWLATASSDGGANANLLQLCIAPPTTSSPDFKFKFESAESRMAVLELALQYRKAFPNVFGLPADRSAGETTTTRLLLS